MGNVITLQDGLYEYKIPINEPNNESEILNFNLKKNEQVWHTPKLIDVKKLSQKERIEYIEKERQRWYEGCYILIAGELKYMTGLMYEHLTMNTYNSQKLLYFDDERYIFYFIDLTENDTTCTGRTWIKPRRAKMTTIMCSLAQRKLLSDFSNYITIQSDTLDKAQKSYMTPIIDSYTRRPLWARELYYAPNGKKPRKALELTSNVIQEEGTEWLGGKINIFPTVAKAIDGLEAVECIIDEFSKIEDTIPYEMFEIARKVIQNFRKEGKIDALSSSGDSKDAVKATMDWHKLIANSNPNNKDQFGKTVSGNWEYFISAIHSQYVPKEFTDIYGIVNKEKAEEWVWNEIRKYPEGTKEYIYALYKLPLKKEHALLSSAIANLFGKARISARLTELEGMLPEQKPYVRGKLIEEQNGKVYFEADPTGLWLWAIHPYFSIENGIDTRNRFRIYNDVFFPYPNSSGVVGYDPINYPKENIKSVNFSQACLFVRNKFDYYNQGLEDCIMGMYLGRPDNPHDVNDEAMKTCKYTGFCCMHERSVSHPYEDFRDKNMLPFLMKGEDGFYGLTTNQKIIRDGVAMLQTRYSPPKNPDEKDQIETYPFEDGLRSLDNFDQSNTTAFDPTMAEIMCEQGLKQITFTNVTDGQLDKMNDIIHQIIPIRN
jgi:hypothetical protein